MASEGKKPTKTIIDVAHPGKSAPSSTSKPVIVTNRPILKDPMVVTVKDAEEPADKADDSNLLKPSTKPKIEPLKTVAPDETAPEEPAQTKADEAEEAPAAAEEPVAEETPAEDKAKAETEAGDEAEKTDGEAATVAPGLSPEQIDAEAQKEAKHDAEIQKLVDSKKYFLPINSVEKRRAKNFILIGVLVSLLLAVAWADVAMDAGLLHIGNLKPLTHFFSN